MKSCFTFVWPDMSEPWVRFPSLPVLCRTSYATGVSENFKKISLIISIARLLLLFLSASPVPADLDCLLRDHSGLNPGGWGVMNFWFCCYRSTQVAECCASMPTRLRASGQFVQKCFCREFGRYLSKQRYIPMRVLNRRLLEHGLFCDHYRKSHFHTSS